MNQKPISKKSLTAREVAEVYGLEVGTLANLRCQKRGPKYYRVGRKVLYWVDDVEKWVKRVPVLTLDSMPEVETDEN